MVADLETGSLRDRFSKSNFSSPLWGFFCLSLGVLLEILGSPIRCTLIVAFQGLNVPERNTVTMTAGMMIAVTVICSQVELCLKTNLKSLQLLYLGILLEVNRNPGGQWSFPPTPIFKVQGSLLLMSKCPKVTLKSCLFGGGGLFVYCSKNK